MKCEDCSHAEMCKWIDELEGRGCDFGLVELIDSLPSVQTKPTVTQKSGKWIKDECGNVICSECKRFRRDCRYGHTNYCNHCGARMFEPRESEKISERNMKMWEEIFKAESEDKG